MNFILVELYKSLKNQGNLVRRTKSALETCPTPVHPVPRALAPSQAPPPSHPVSLEVIHGSFTNYHGTPRSKSNIPVKGIDFVSHKSVPYIKEEHSDERTTPHSWDSDDEYNKGSQSPLLARHKSLDKKITIMSSQDINYKPSNIKSLPSLLKRNLPPRSRSERYTAGINKSEGSSSADSIDDDYFNIHKSSCDSDSTVVDNRISKYHKHHNSQEESRSTPSLLSGCVQTRDTSCSGSTQTELLLSDSASMLESVSPHSPRKPETGKNFIC